MRKIFVKFERFDNQFTSKMGNQCSLTVLGINIVAGMERFDYWHSAPISRHRWSNSLRWSTCRRNRRVNTRSIIRRLAAKRQFPHRIGRSYVADRLRIYKRQVDRSTSIQGDVNTRRDANGWPAITSPSLMMCITVVRARQRDERNRRRPVVPRIGRRVHKSSGIRARARAL